MHLKKRSSFTLAMLALGCGAVGLTGCGGDDNDLLNPNPGGGNVQNFRVNPPQAITATNPQIVTRDNDFTLRGGTVADDTLTGGFSGVDVTFPRNSFDRDMNFGAEVITRDRGTLRSFEDPNLFPGGAPAGVTPVGEIAVGPVDAQSGAIDVLNPNRAGNINLTVPLNNDTFNRVNQSLTTGRRLTVRRLQTDMTGQWVLEPAAGCIGELAPTPTPSLGLRGDCQGYLTVTAEEFTDIGAVDF